MIWNVKNNNVDQKVSLYINKILGLGIVFIGNKIAYKTLRLFKNNKLKFAYHNHDYAIKLIEDNQIFYGDLTVDGKYSFRNEDSYKSAPWYSIFLILPTLAAPVIATENIMFWLIAAVFSSLIVKVSKSRFGFVKKAFLIILVTFISWLLCYMFYLGYIKGHVRTGSFIRWKLQR